SLYASIGNKISTDDAKENFKLFQRIDYLNKLTTGFSLICLFVLFNPFIILWIGEEFVFEDITVFLIVAVFFVDSQTYRKTANLFKNATGLFSKDKYASLIEGALNLSISLLLVNWIGINGILLGTVIAFLLTAF